MDQLPLLDLPPTPAPITPRARAKGMRSTTHTTSTKAMGLGTVPPLPRFDGATYEEQRDGVRLTHQLRRVLEAMRDGHWHTLHQLHAATGDPEASISARLRDLRKPRHGALTILRRHKANGLHEYRLQPGDTGAEASTRGECPSSGRVA